MGILQAGYRTYEAQSALAGVAVEGREPLTPVAHMIAKAQIEITITDDGSFESAAALPETECKTVIPTTIESANRARAIAPHPLCDQLCYLAPFGGERYTMFCSALEEWNQSPHSHPKVSAVLSYVSGGTIVNDLARAGVIVTDESGLPGSGTIESTDFAKCMIRWRVVPAPEGGTAACWQDIGLMNCYAEYYTSHLDGERTMCYVSGDDEVISAIHPRGTVSLNNGAKLISANDSSGFTYRGRFTEAGQACSVGYVVSQKAHNALRWVAANSRVIIGGRAFLCWNPEGGAMPSLDMFQMFDDRPRDFESYSRQLRLTLGGYRQALPTNAGVVIAALDAATTGRLSVTYYNELRCSDFLDRLENWYSTFCWNSRGFGIHSPSLKNVVGLAFGVEREAFVDADPKVAREHMQQLLHCVIDRQPIPLDVVHMLVSRASTPLAYKPFNRENLLVVACAAVRKCRNDKAKKEELKLSLDVNNTDRSYLFGRLLAVAELAERSTYDRDEGREPNAIRLQALFSQRPLYAWRIICDQLNPYFAKMNPGLRAYFKNAIGEITDMLPSPDNKALDLRLDDVYLLGYYHQRSEMTRKKDRDTNAINEIMEGETNE